MRATVTTTPQRLFGVPSGGDNSDALTRRFDVFSPTSTGTVLLEVGNYGDDPTTIDFSAAARVDFSKMTLQYGCEPGKALFAKTASGSVDLDMLPGGER